MFAFVSIIDTFSVEQIIVEMPSDVDQEILEDQVSEKLIFLSEFLAGFVGPSLQFTILIPDTTNLAVRLRPGSRIGSDRWPLCFRQDQEFALPPLIYHLE